MPHSGQPHAIPTIGRMAGKSARLAAVAERAATRPETGSAATPSSVDTARVGAGRDRCTTALPGHRGRESGRGPSRSGGVGLVGLLARTRRAARGTIYDVGDYPPFEAYVFAMTPLPAWSVFMDPAFRPGSSPDLTPTAEDVSQAVLRHFAFLREVGFDVAPPDNWERGTTLAIPFARDDAVVLVVAVEMSSLFVAVTPTVEGPVTARRVLEALVRAGPDAPVASFGAFPLLVGGAHTLDHIVARHADAFEDALGDLLQSRPANIALIASAATEAVERASRSVQVSYYRGRAAQASADRRDAATVEAYERLSQLAPLQDDEADRLAAARQRLAQVPPSLERQGESDREWLERRVEHLRRKHHLLHAAWQDSTGAGAHAAWEDAAREFREAIEIMYPPEFWADLRRLQDGHPSAVEPMLLFLEVDPWCFRSGYAKETILYRLRRHALSQEQRGRLETVLLRGVDIGDRREFRYSCKLARRNTSPVLREALRERLHSDDPGVARRALWMLTALRRPRLNAADVAVARAIVLRAASGPDSDYWSVPNWVGRLAWRFWSPEWAEELLTTALDAEPGADAALRVLSDVPKVRLDPDQREQLASILLSVVDQGHDETWFEGIAPLVDSPALRDQLERRRRDPDDDVRRRAWWALNATLRATGGERTPDVEHSEAP